MLAHAADRSGLSARPGKIGPMETAEPWRLHDGDLTLALLYVTEQAFPWLHATVRADPGFSKVARLFADELRLLDELGDVETPEWTAAYEAIRAATQLAGPDGRDVPEFLLHIDGDQAWWRWSDDAFVPQQTH
jgi:hypothetical protein